MHWVKHDGLAIAQSSWSATRLITAALPSRRRRRVRCGCRARSNSIVYSGANSCRVPSIAPGVLSLAPAARNQHPIWRVWSPPLPATPPLSHAGRREASPVYPGAGDMNAIARVTESWPLHARFEGPIVMIGFGSIGKGTLPLIERHVSFDRSKFAVIAPDDRDRHLLDERQIRFMHTALTPQNYREILTPLLTRGPGRGMMVNLSVDTSSVALMEFRKDTSAFYIDTVVEPWPGLYTDRTLSISQRSNYALREDILELRRRRPGGVTAVSCCGANPGMVSWMVKQALLDIAHDTALPHEEPHTREDW